jgi:hypothetical protein
MDFAGEKLQRRPIQRLRGVKAFGDMAHF